jgi:hypothetical protein
MGTTNSYGQSTNDRYYSYRSTTVTDTTVIDRFSGGSRGLQPPEKRPENRGL